MLIEGPYGHSTPFHTYETLILIAGGSGIAGALSYLKDYATRSAATPPTTKTTSITFIWATRQEAMVNSIAARELAPVIANPEINTSIFVTKSRPITPKDHASEKTGSGSSSPAGALALQYGRPHIKKALLQVVEAESGRGRIAVLVCGPAAMADEGRAAVHVALKQGHRGVDYFEEAFGW